jgi:hypothetical protein
MAVHIDGEYMTDYLDQAKLRLRALVEETVDYTGCMFKVGMSVEPIGRIVGVSTANRIPPQHGKLNRTYRGMGSLSVFVLFRTYDYGKCQDAERDMIQILQDIAPPGQVLNQTGGGGGRRSVRFPHYVYLVRSS